MSDHPWFKFYVADYSIGTKLFTLEEDGAYIRCLCHQWDAGAVPGDDMKSMAALLRVSVPKAKAVWAVIAKKFVRDEDGLWRNQRMEKERQWLNDKREAGRAGGLAKAKQTPSREPSKPLAEGYQTASKALAEGYQSEVRSQKSDPELRQQRTLSSSAHARDDDPKRVDSRPIPLIQGPLAHAKRMQWCHFAGQRVEVLKTLHAELVGKIGGENPDAVLVAWYHELDDRVVAEKTSVPDWPTWVRAQYQAWAGERVTDDAYAKVEQAIARRRQH